MRALDVLACNRLQEVSDHGGTRLPHLRRVRFQPDLDLLQLGGQLLSADDTIRQEASDLPRVIAWEAVYRQVPGAVQQMVYQLEGVYTADVGELSMGGLRDLPVTGLARSCLHAPFRSLLTFTNYNLARAVIRLLRAARRDGTDGRCRLQSSACPDRMLNRGDSRSLMDERARRRPASPPLSATAP